MANTLTGLIPTLYTALDVVSRELIGFIPNVNRDAKASSGAVGQTVRSPIVPAASIVDITPGMTPNNGGGQTINYADVVIQNQKAAEILWTGEEQLSLSNQFGEYDAVLAGQFAEGFRGLANLIEKDLAAIALANASRAYGTAGTTPFATAGDLSDLAEINHILDDNGAPATNRVMIVNSAARAKLEGKQSELFKVNEAGDAGAMLRQREMRKLQGFTMGYSAGIAAHTAGTGASYLVNGALAAGASAVVVDTGTGTVLAGDVVTFAADSANKYMVNSALATSTLSIGNPGLKVAIADNNAMTVGGAFTPNFGFTPNALVLATRLPAMPAGGDNAADVRIIIDPVSGLSFQVAMYKLYHQVKIEIGIVWGVAGVKSEHVAVLLG